jgi:hypothetical protein
MNSTIASWTSKIGKAPYTYGIALQKFLSLLLPSCYVSLCLVSDGELWSTLRIVFKV